MLYKQFKDDNISLLGFGCMRFPVIAGTNDIDVALTEKMVDYAIAHGVNYFDTAAPYMGGKSEPVIGNILKKYPRDSFYLATKYPGHQLKPGLDSDQTTPEYIFEHQLEKCKVDYFDYYLLHNVCENSYDVYLDDNRGILEYFLKQKELGRIRHLGFSSHGAPDNLEDYLKRTEGKLEFCQIQLNYLDWTLQEAKEKCELLQKYGLGIWVMESVRGGRLAQMTPEIEKEMKALRPDESVASWAFRWLIDKPYVNVSLSGMSSMEQVEDNIKTYETIKPLTEADYKVIDKAVKSFDGLVPCTACGYCLNECPQKLDIPKLMKTYNDISVNYSFTPAMYVEVLPEEKKPSACLECRACEAQCPQKIEISQVMKKLDEKCKSKPSWAQVCEERMKPKK